jgi:hypothetical protein
MSMFGLTMASLDAHLSSGNPHEADHLGWLEAQTEVEDDDKFIDATLCRLVDSDVQTMVFASAADCVDELGRLIEKLPQGTSLVRTLIAVQGVARSLRNAIDAEASRRMAKDGPRAYED